jgi:hypothetical protein
MWEYRHRSPSLASSRFIKSTRSFNSLISNTNNISDEDEHSDDEGTSTSLVGTHDEPVLPIVALPPLHHAETTQTSLPPSARPSPLAAVLPDLAHPAQAQEETPTGAQDLLLGPLPVHLLLLHHPHRLVIDRIGLWSRTTGRADGRTAAMEHVRPRRCVCRFGECPSHMGGTRTLRLRDPNAQCCKYGAHTPGARVDRARLVEDHLGQEDPPQHAQAVHAHQADRRAQGGLLLVSSFVPIPC